MPQIHLEYFECVFFIYGSHESAERGDSTGGTGFLLGVPSQKQHFLAHIYAVTNVHNLAQSELGSLYARFNMLDGSHSVMEIPESSWERHPHGDDVAIAPIHIDLDSAHQRYISTNLMLTESVFMEKGIGPGDETFMIGRFTGKEQEGIAAPTARFGNISTVLAQPVRQPLGFVQDSFISEMRSQCGYSGAPVFVYLWPFFTRFPHIMEGHQPTEMAAANDTRVGPWLLGINWGHDEQLIPILDEDSNPVEPRAFTKANSGISYTVPADKIRDLLMLDKFVQSRNDAESRWAKNCGSALD